MTCCVATWAQGLETWAPGPRARGPGPRRADGRRAQGPRAQGPWGPGRAAQTSVKVFSNEEKKNQKSHLFFEVYFGLFLRNPYFFENKKEPQRNCEQFPGSSASRSLTCVRKQRIWETCMETFSCRTLAFRGDLSWRPFVGIKVIGA